MSVEERLMQLTRVVGSSTTNVSRAPAAATPARDDAPASNELLLSRDCSLLA